ncbi:putative ABC transporter [Klebsiella pneumoniae]|nr:putative ABC transporter [Klebsiella pneumoniae]
MAFASLLSMQAGSTRVPENAVQQVLAGKGCKVTSLLKPVCGACEQTLKIRILAESPRDVFSSDLRRDISRWRYVTTGPVNDQVVTVIFKIDGRIQLIS